MNVKVCAIVAGVFMLAGTTSWVVHAQTVRSEAAAHPRIATAIRELEGAGKLEEALRLADELNRMKRSPAGA